MFLPTDGAKLNSAYHQDFFPGELGFEFVDGVQHNIPWGQKGPRPDNVTNVHNWDSNPRTPSPTLRW